MSDNLQQKTRVLVCPLNWGLGHASRCIPVIRKLQQAGFEVLVAADGRALALMQNECPDLMYIRLPGFSPRFSAGSKLIWKIISWLPALAWHTCREHHKIKQIVRDHKISVVISDNRFGLYTKAARCIFITHQVMIKTPSSISFLEPVLYRINRFIIEKFDDCWIPDLPGINNLSGDLSHKYPLPRNAHFVGLLSRFRKNNQAGSEIKGPLLAVLSGPEPQRSIFEELVKKQLSEINQEAIIVSGTPEKMMPAKSGKQLTILNHLETEELGEAMTRAGIVICRSGYSSLMDIVVLKKKEVLLVPTPGQTEQEYLAERVLEKGWLIAQKQNNFDLQVALDEMKNCEGIDLADDNSLLSEQIFLLNEQVPVISAKR